MHMVYNTYLFIYRAGVLRHAHGFFTYTDTV